MKIVDWSQFRRMVGRSPATPLPTQEGQIRYERIGTGTGKFYIARFVSGGTYAWHELTDNLPLTGGTVSGNATFQGDVTVGNAQGDTLIIGSHIRVTGADPVLTATPVGTYPAVGTTPSGVTLTAGNDTEMEINLTTGTGCATGLLLHVAFATARASSSYGVHVQARTAGSAQLFTYPTSRGTGGFDLTCPVAPADATALGFFLWVVEL